MAVRICRELGIDDPVYWMNNTDPRILDLWIADCIVESEDHDHRNPQDVLGSIIKTAQPAS